jgi:hypothetical protein
MQEILLPPNAPVLIESMRSIGYSLESAVADLVDNSISAKASTVRIRFCPYGNPNVAILDDGEGMSGDRLTEAMRHGSCNPLDIRSGTDLGRFGLGLKTASLSQCRKLTVVSLREGELSARCWDLDLIAERKAWVLAAPDDLYEIRQMPLVEDLDSQGHGTVVIWQGLDRLGAGESSIETALGEKMDRTRDHLSVVFHRYISGEPGLSAIALSINDNPINPIDPFLMRNPATQRMYDEDFSVDGQPIHVQPFILPHISRLSAEDMAIAGGEEGLRRNQGFYVYRNRRLIIWGTWFQLARQRELSKLARVRVDIPNTLDHLWTLDIKKSGAHPPEEVRRNLKRTVDRIAEGSRRTYTYRGRRTNKDGLTHAWHCIKGRGGIRYDISREHPLLTALSETLDDRQQKMLGLLLETLETTFPFDALYADMADERPRGAGLEKPEETLRELAAHLLSAVPVEGHSEFLNAIGKVDPFCLYPEITATIVAEIMHANR